MMLSTRADRLIKAYFDAALREGGFRAIGNMPNPAPYALAAAYDQLSSYIGDLEELRRTPVTWQSEEIAKTKKASWHATISYWKSFLRIIGFGVLPFSLRGAAVVLVIAELLGVAEEVFGT